MFHDSESQLHIPDSFIALYTGRGQAAASRLRTSRDVVAARYEICEDLALMLTDRARHIRADLNVTEEDVLVRVYRGLLDEASGVTPPEAHWIMVRLAELLDWTPLPTLGKRSSA